MEWNGMMEKVKWNKMGYEEMEKMEQKRFLWSKSGTGGVEEIHVE
jgi:hypothetical protein